MARGIIRQSREYKPGASALPSVAVVEYFGEGRFEAWKQLTVGAGGVLASSRVPDVLERAFETLVKGLRKLC